MADITSNAVDLSAGGFQTVTARTLTANDTLTFKNAPQQRMVLVNASGSSKTITFDGDGAANIDVPGFGVANPTGGLSVTLANNAITSILLPTRNEWMRGTIAITGGTGVTYYLFEN